MYLPKSCNHSHFILFKVLSEFFLKICHIYSRENVLEML